jgi:O-antigen/teichoic acid export membrane protein
MSGASVAKESNVRAWVSVASLAQYGALAAGAMTNIFYARWLDPAQIGRLAILFAVAAAVALIADGGLQVLLTRALATKEVDPESALTLLVIVVPVLVVLVWLVLSAADGVAYAVGGRSIGSLMTLALLAELALTICFFQVAITLQQGLGRYVARSLLLLGNGAATTVLSGILLVTSASVFTAVQATAAAYFLAAVAGIAPVLRRWRPRSVRPSEVISFLAQARPLWLNGGLGYLSSTADVLVAGLVLPLASVGYYQVTKKLATLFIGPLMTILPILYASFARLARPLWREQLQRTQRLATTALAAGLVGASGMLEPTIRILYGPRYAAHAVVLVVLVVAGGFQFHHNLLGYVSAAAGHFVRPLVINVPVAIVMVAGAAAAGATFGLNGFIAAVLGANILGLAIAARLTTDLVGRSGDRVTKWAALLLSAMGIAIALVHVQPAIAIPLGVACGVLLALAMVGVDGLCRLKGRVARRVVTE